MKMISPIPSVIARGCRGALLLCLASHLTYGQGTPGRLVWPAPPDDPRIAYVGSISCPQDAGFRPAMLRRFSNWLSGAQVGNQPMSHPFGVAVDGAGNFCFTDTGLNNVTYCDRAGKKWYTWGEVGGTRFQAPVAVAADGKVIYVADSSLATVIQFDLAGKIMGRIAAGLQRPCGLAISGGRLYVVDSAAQCVDIFDLKGKSLGRFGQRGDGPGFFNYPTHIAADGPGNLYVTDSMNNRVQIFDPAGNYIREIGQAGDSPGCFSRPKGVAVDPAGRIYVVDAMFGNFQIFDAGGQLLLAVGETGSDPGEFSLPAGIAISGGNQIYVADTFNGRLQEFKYIAAP
ncbi:MAG TPA: 6-bladed beta-propeller [Chthoniobacteraceae bacterium]|nr:6-bladed beta-propeller [Chthoniobacteraceae bacterium]